MVSFGLRSNWQNSQIFWLARVRPLNHSDTLYVKYYKKQVVHYEQNVIDFSHIFISILFCSLFLNARFFPLTYRQNIFNLDLHLQVESKKYPFRIMIS